MLCPSFVSCAGKVWGFSRADVAKYTQECVCVVRGVSHDKVVCFKAILIVCNTKDPGLLI